MSRAFVKEVDHEPIALPDRPISEHRNFVTPNGFAAIEAALLTFERSHRHAVSKGAAEAIRELRYWRARRSSAEVVQPRQSGAVAFGSKVTLRRDDGREQTFQIVGEDEANPVLGTVSHVSPLARAVMTRGPGQTVTIAGRDAEILDVQQSVARFDYR